MAGQGYHILHESHGLYRAYGCVTDCIEYGLVVDVENDVAAPKLIPPTTYSLNNSQHFLRLNVCLAQAARAAGQKPFHAKMPTQTLLTCWHL